MLCLNLAFDKPTVIIKDDKTDYSFDTGVIEHVTYPRDLRFARIVEFKTKLAEKVGSTYRASISVAKHSPFLKSFGQFQVASLPQTETSADRVMMEMLTDMQRDLSVIRRRGLRAEPSISQIYEGNTKAEILRAVFDARCSNLKLDPATVAADPSYVEELRQLMKNRYRFELSPFDIRVLLQQRVSKIPMNDPD